MKKKRKNENYPDIIFYLIYQLPGVWKVFLFLSLEETDGNITNFKSDATSYCFYNS